MIQPINGLHPRYLLSEEHIHFCFFCLQLFSLYLKAKFRHLTNYLVDEIPMLLCLNLRYSVHSYHVIIIVKMYASIVYWV